MIQISSVQTTLQFYVLNNVVSNSCATSVTEQQQERSSHDNMHVVAAALVQPA